MSGIPINKWNLEQREIDGTDRKMRRTGLHVKCSRYKKITHNKVTCKMLHLPSQDQSTQTQETQGT